MPWVRPGYLIARHSNSLRSSEATRVPLADPTVVAHDLAMGARTGPGEFPYRATSALVLGVLLLTACSSPATTKSYATDWFHALLEASIDRGPVDANL